MAKSLLEKLLSSTRPQENSERIMYIKHHKFINCILIDLDMNLANLCSAYKVDKIK